MRFIRNKFRRKKEAATPSAAVVMYWARELWDEPENQDFFLPIPPSGLESASEAFRELEAAWLGALVVDEFKSDSQLGLVEVGGWALLRQAALVSALREGYDIYDFDSLCQALSELGIRVKRLKA